MEKPQGWASLTRLHNSNASASPLPQDPFPSLRGEAENSGVAAAGSGARRAPSLQAPFVSVVSKGLATVATSSGARLSPEDAAVARLRELHGWADDVLLRDVLRAVDGDEGMASQQLDAMAGPEEPPKDSGIGDEIRSGGAVECAENDVYLKFRREALRLSRYVWGLVECQYLSTSLFQIPFWLSSQCHQKRKIAML